MLVDTASKLVPLSQNGPVAATRPPAATISGGTAVDHPNPQYQLNAEIGIVVIQFRSQSGRVELSIPSQAKLDAYTANPFGPLPGSAPPVDA